MTSVKTVPTTAPNPGTVLSSKKKNSSFFFFLGIILGFLFYFFSSDFWRDEKSVTGCKRIWFLIIGTLWKEFDKFKINYFESGFRVWRTELQNHWIVVTKEDSQEFCYILSFGLIDAQTTANIIVIDVVSIQCNYENIIGPIHSGWLSPTEHSESSLTSILPLISFFILLISFYTWSQCDLLIYIDNRRPIINQSIVLKNLKKTLKVKKN